MNAFILLLPLLGFVLNGLFGKRLGKSAVGLVGSGVVLGAFVLSLLAFIQVNTGGAFQENWFTWLQVGSLNVPVGMYFDELSTLMMLVVTGVGFLIHVYSVGYMHDDEGFYKFFAYLNLFIFSMLLLITGSNYVLLFFGWEGVGLCSYLLIGFWYQNADYGKAARKAFIMNRIGDLGLLLGLFLLFNQFGSLQFTDLFQVHAVNSSVINTIGLLLFVGAMGKSAQIPLYTWLPDAMAGPTPVSALIHAATMVTAGIYLVCRSHFIYTDAESARQVIATVGLLTAVFAGTIGLKQNDIKKVLAYSTVSQLGYMFVALGVGAYSTAMFHVTTHAFFKALLFLGSGSVIHAMGGEQDIRKMGALKKALPITHATFLIGTLAIAGVPPLAGFFSKDEILAKVYYGHGPVFFTLLCIASVITAIYMFRLYFLTFHGTFRGTKDQAHHLHESPSTMTIPLIVLAFLSICGGFLGTPAWMNHLLGTSSWMEHHLAFLEGPTIMEASSFFEYTVLLVSIIVLLAVYTIMKKRYVTNGLLPESDSEEKGIARLLSHKYFIDEAYDAVIVKPLAALSRMLGNIIDRQVVDGAVNATGQVVTETGKFSRLLQNGFIELYLLAMVFGLVLVFVVQFMH